MTHFQLCKEIDELRKMIIDVSDRMDGVSSAVVNSQEKYNAIVDAAYYDKDIGVYIFTPEQYERLKKLC